MVFKVFKKISKVSLFLQIFYAAFLFVLALLLKLNKESFLAGFVFSYLYAGLFFYSIKMIWTKENKRLGFFLMFVKWLLLFMTLFLVAWFLDAKSFLLGLGMLLGLFIFYIAKQLKLFSGAFFRDQ